MARLAKILAAPVLSLILWGCACPTAPGHVTRSLTGPYDPRREYWDEIREVMRDCCNQTRQFGRPAREAAFSLMAGDAPADIRALVLCSARLPVTGKDELQRNLDALTVFEALGWLTRHKDPETGPLGYARLDDSDSLVLSGAISATRWASYWAATPKVSEVLRRIPKDPRHLGVALECLLFLAASPESGREMCELKSLIAPLDAYCAEPAQALTGLPLACQDFGDAWRAIEMRFQCENGGR